MGSNNISLVFYMYLILYRKYIYIHIYIYIFATTMRYNSKIIFLIVSRKRMKIKKRIIRNHGKRNIRNKKFNKT